MEDINLLRKKIDKIDSSILTLLHERLKVVNQIKNYKTINHDHIFAPDREIKIIQNLIKKNKGREKKIQAKIAPPAR